MRIKRKKLTKKELDKAIEKEVIRILEKQGKKI